MKYLLGLILFLLIGQKSFGQALPSSSIQVTTRDSTMIDDSLKNQMDEEKGQIASKMAKATLTHFIIRVPDEKFGYTVFIDGKMYIEQKSIPAISGNAGFVSKEDAEKVAKLVIEKIKQGEMPPTISIQDLQLLKIEN